MADDLFSSANRNGHVKTGTKLLRLFWCLIFELQFFSFPFGLSWVRGDQTKAGMPRRKRPFQQLPCHVF